MSTGTTGAIKAGAAYVQAYLDDNPLTQGLAKLQTKLKGWQASMSKLGASAYGGELPEPFAALARFAASPAGAFSALLGAAKYTAAAREEMLKMSETTGVAVDKLSALSYAARRAGVSNEALASGLQRLQSKEFQMAMQGAGRGGVGGGFRGAGGSKGGGGGHMDFAAALGLDKHAGADEQLRQIVKQFEKLDSMSRIGLAKKLGISELLPLINQGIENLDRFTARARELGLVMSEEDAKAGKQFELALGDLHEVLMSSVKAIGGALVPLITGLTNLIVPVVVSVRDWIKNHKALTIAIFAGTGAIVFGGIALKGMAIATGLASTAIGALKGAFALASFVVGVFNGVLTVTQALMGSTALPFLLVGAAVVGVLVYIGHLSGAFSNLGKQWQGFAEDTTSSITAIANAISKGDLTGAWDVVTAYFSTEWTRLVNTLQGVWEGYRGYFTEVGYGIQVWWTNFCAWFETTWRKCVDTVKDGMRDLGTIAQGTAGGALGGMLASAMNGGGVMDMFGAGVKGATQGAAGGMGQVAHDQLTTSHDYSGIEAQRKADEERLGAANAKAAADRAARLASSEADLQKKREALNHAVDAANAPANKPPEDDKKGKDAFRAAQAAETRGTFSGAVARMLGGGGKNVAQQQLDVAKQHADSTARAREAAEAAAKQQLRETQRTNAILAGTGVT